MLVDPAIYLNTSHITSLPESCYMFKLAWHKRSSLSPRLNSHNLNDRKREDTVKVLRKRRFWTNRDTKLKRECGLELGIKIYMLVIISPRYCSFKVDDNKLNVKCLFFPQ